jgi:hypothetical protein
LNIKEVNWEFVYIRLILIFFCNFTFYCCLIDNLHTGTSCSCLHNTYKCIQFDHAKEFFFFLIIHWKCFSMYKLVHRTIPTNTFLYKCRLVETKLCTVWSCKRVFLFSFNYIMYQQCGTIYIYVCNKQKTAFASPSSTHTPFTQVQI